MLETLCSLPRRFPIAQEVHCRRAFEHNQTVVLHAAVLFRLVQGGQSKPRVPSYHPFGSDGAAALTPVRDTRRTGGTLLLHFVWKYGSARVHLSQRSHAAARVTVASH